MQTYSDRKTPEMVEALRQLWADLAEVEQIEPGLGHYPHDLEFFPPELERGKLSSTYTDNAGDKWHFAPDQHYFQAQGVEVEEDEVRPDPKLRAIVTWCLLLLFLAEVWALLFWVGAV